MSFTTTTVHLTPEGIFPTVPGLAKNEKCQTIVKMFHEIAEQSERFGKTQDEVQAEGSKQLLFVNQKKRLRLNEVDDLVVQLFSKGVSRETAMEFVSYRLSPENRDAWRIISGSPSEEEVSKAVEATQRQIRDLQAVVGRRAKPGKARAAQKAQRTQLGDARIRLKALKALQEAQQPVEVKMADVAAVIMPPAPAAASETAESSSCAIL